MEKAQLEVFDKWSICSDSLPLVGGAIEARGVEPSYRWTEAPPLLTPKTFSEVLLKKVETLKSASFNEKTQLEVFGKPSIDSDSSQSSFNQDRQSSVIPLPFFERMQ